MSIRGNCIAAAAATGLMLLSAPAFAWNQVENDAGARVIASGRRIVIHDNKCDNEAVKGKWKYENKSTADMHSKNNNAGCNTEVPMDTSAIVHGIQACTVYRALPDECSTWRHWD
jgi:hypothetical protein